MKRCLRPFLIFLGIVITIWLSASRLSFAQVAHPYKNGDEAKADIDRWTEVIKQHPDDAQAFSGRGDANGYLANYEEALADYTAAIKLDAKYANAYYGRGIMNFLTEHYDTAVADFTQAIKLNPNYAEAYRERGSSYLAKNDYKNATSDITTAIKLNPNDADANFRLGNAYINSAEISGDKTDYDKSIAAFTEAIKLKPDTFKYDWRGHAYSEKGDYENAITDYTSELNLNASEDGGRLNRGWNYIAIGDYDSAMADFKRVIQNFTNDGAFEGLAVANYASGDLEEALKWFQISAKEGIGLNEKGGEEISVRPRFFIWLIEVEQNHQTDGPNKELASALKTYVGSATDWIPQIGHYLLGDLSEENFLKTASVSKRVSNLAIPPNQTGEANFFVGMKHLLSGDTSGAKAFFQKCLDTGEKSADWYQFAKVRLAHLH